MTLHVPTIFIALLMAIVLFGAALAHAGDVRTGHGALQRWAWGTWCAAGGFVLLGSRLMLPETLSVIGGNTLIALSLLLTGHALHRFLREADVPRWQVALVPLQTVMLLAILDLPLARRTALLSLFYALQLAPSVWLIARHVARSERSMRMVGATLGLTVLALLLRTAHATLDPSAYADFFQASLGNGLTYLAAFLFPLGAGFGFLLANLERSSRRLEQLATHDALTGCANRTLFDAMLQATLDQSRRDGTPASLLVLDLDHFKDVNDRHGHLAGDAVLRACAQALKARLRASDLLARLGGEEFAVVLARSTRADALRVAEDLRAAVAGLDLAAIAAFADATPWHVTASLGAATLPGGTAVAPDEFYGQADRALYEAKRLGRNRVVHATAAILGRSMPAASATEISSTGASDRAIARTPVP
ncbi:GGDEF domain-containing protein [Leptothrix discophora]|uniref:diguanylate cyclase n=1 Tax=Leptothrix discophora TaxID=89 RepID=A0ABT9G6T8_LEPDI|nr:GGDEF domain-containing protein [Leptothrix discophora]MDP4302183.1 GGDEF domain-containing protein [Leptothrix discophora]